MYFVNTYRWDFDKVMALCAPRPLLLGNSDKDDIFPVPGYRRLADKVRRIYDLYGAGDRFALLETAGQHKDTPELRLGAYRWMNRWLKNDNAEVTEPERPRLTPGQLRVVDDLPEDAINRIIHEVFRKPARIEMPESPAVARSWWQGYSVELRHALRRQVFGGWPDNPPALDVRPAGEVVHDGLRLCNLDFVSEEEVGLRLWLLTAARVEKPTLLVLNVMDEAGWKEWCKELGPAFRDCLQLPANPVLDAYRGRRNRQLLERTGWAFAAVAPRGIGPTRWSTVGADGKSIGHQIRRRFALLGQTLDGQRVWDVRRAVQCLRSQAELKSTPLWMQAKGEMAGVALYAALFQPEVTRLDLWHLPASHRQGPTFLNVRRNLDTPQALALAFPSQVRLYVTDDAAARDWEWPLQLQQKLGQEYLILRKVSLPEAIHKPAAEVGRSD
jgi:hypothetical protein